IISQFDKFFENEKLILSFAAIAGREFKFEVIEYISKKMRLKINLFSAMKKFCDNNFLHFIGNNKEKNTYLFNHDLLRDAIISSISFKIKTKIHNYIGEWIENHDTEKQNEIIAFHFKNAGNIKKAVHYLNISAKQASEKYANNQAIDYYSQLIELYSKNYRNFSKEIKIQLIEIYQARGLAWRLIGKYDKAIEDFSMMLILAKKIKNIKKIISANNHIGSVYRWKGNQRKALKYCKESLKKAMEINDDRLIASCSNSISVVYWYLGKYYKAIETGKKSIELRRKMGDISMVSRGLFSIGNCYTKICNYSEAEKCFNELLSIAQKINDKIGLAYSYDGLGYCCKELAEYCCALDYHQKAYNLRIETGDARGLGYSYISFGDIRRILGDFHGAAEYYNKAYITIKSIQDENLMSDVLRCMALSELDYLNINKSEELITQSIELSERLQFTESTIKSGIVFAEILFRKNDLNKALNIIKKSLKESIRCGMTDNFINALIIKTSVMISLNCSKKEITNNINIAFKTAKTTGFPLLKLKVLRLIIDNINLLPLSLSTSDESTHNYFIEYNKLLSDINKKINNDADKTNFIQKYKLV
ncbi:tetratricopeptide repeat protein, partial [Candidatus Dependentiae bacterium]|nr:tetratricopeptide repeat protein [Candidatus Dependentiae bacterium]